MQRIAARRSVVLGGAGTVVALITACAGAGSDGTVSLAGATSSTSDVSPTALPPRAPLPRAPVSPPSASSLSVSSNARLLRLGSSGPEVVALQRRLAELGYWTGPDGVKDDGKYGNLTAQAVLAVQKVARIGRDGVVGPRTRAVLEAGVRPSPRSTSGRMIEVDLARQVLLVVAGGQLRYTLNTSTGSGQWYTRPDGATAHAVTPRGRYTVFRWVDGWDTSPLGHLYRSRYFNGGISVHGYPSVPAHPASHGCVRVSLPAMDMIWADGLMPRGGSVWVY